MDISTLTDTGLEYEAPQPQAAGGLEGASRISREMASWQPAIISPDQQINPHKELIDARARDRVMNDGYIAGAEQMHRDNIVGGQFSLNSRPNWRVLGLDETWAEEFQIEVESKFGLWWNSLNNWPDAARRNSGTELVRLAIGCYLTSGEVAASAEWLRTSSRPYKTAIQMIDPDRISNPNGEGDTRSLRRGVERNLYGEPIAYHVRSGHPSEWYDNNANRWTRVPSRKPWGRLQFIHIVEQMRIDQSRGISAMVSVLKQMHMTQKFQDITLQSAVLQATYAASIESELPPEAAYAQLGMGGTSDWAADFLGQVAAYTGNSKNLHIDGVKIPHLYPGTKLKLTPAGSPGGVGEGFEESLLRHIAASLGLSYEQFSRDYTKTNYSSARASMNETWKYMQSRKKIVADRFASHIYELWFEEAMNAGEIKSLPQNAPIFYDGLNKEAYTQCSWIGAARGQIDEVKETDAAVARINANLSTVEIETARLGQDFREIFAQRSREKKMMTEMDILPPDPIAAKAKADAEAKQESDKKADEKPKAEQPINVSVAVDAKPTSKAFSIRRDEHGTLHVMPQDE